MEPGQDPNKLLQQCGNQESLGYIAETEILEDLGLRLKPTVDAALVCMPWHLIQSPSIQIGTLEAVLENAQIPCRSHSMHLEFMKLLLELPHAQGGMTPQEYEEICSLWGNIGVGEWVFAVPPAADFSKAEEKRQFALLRESGVSREMALRLEALREHVPQFLSNAADAILENHPKVVGFTSVYSQIWPSASLAYLLKERDPDVKIIIGGASCEGPMGPATLKAFPWIDVAVSGEAEGIVADLVGALAKGDSLSDLPGISARVGEEIITTKKAPHKF